VKNQGDLNDDSEKEGREVRKRMIGGELTERNQNGAIRESTVTTKGKWTPM